MNDEALEAILRESIEHDVNRAPDRNPNETSQCLPHSRFFTAMDDGWTPEEERHLESCLHCRRIEALVADTEEASLVPPTPNTEVVESPLAFITRMSRRWFETTVRLPALAGAFAAADASPFSEVREFDDLQMSVTVVEDERELTTTVLTDNAALAERKIELELVGDAESLFAEVQLVPRSAGPGWRGSASFGAFADVSSKVSGESKLRFRVL